MQTERTNASQMRSARAIPLCTSLPENIPKAGSTFGFQRNSVCTMSICLFFPLIRGRKMKVFVVISHVQAVTWDDCAALDFPEMSRIQFWCLLFVLVVCL